MRYKYNWEQIQKDYDGGLSQAGLVKKYKMSSRTVTIAARDGRLKTRSRSEAQSLFLLNNPDKNPAKTVKAREKARKNIQKRYDAGWMPKAGRCKKIVYESKIAGTISVDGTWELKTAKYFDNQSLEWIRNTKKFDYVFDGLERKYTPDFYVKDWDTYIEVKGYETDKDRAKWSQFPLKLKVWKKYELKKLNIL